MSSTLTQHLPGFKTPADFFELYDVSRSSYDTYKKNLKYIGQWLDEHNLPGNLPMEPTIIKDYLLDLVNQKYKPNTIDQRRFSIGWLHRLNGFNDEHNPVYHPALRRIGRQVKLIRAERKLSNRPTQKEPLTFTNLKKLLRRCPVTTMHGLRDRAVLLLGFATGLRRSELVDLDAQDIKPLKDKKTSTARVFIIKSKSDQLAKGQSVVIDAPGGRFCPLTAVKNWKEAAGIRNGKLFRRIRGNDSVQTEGLQPGAIGEIIKKYCEKAGLDPDFYAGHSLRRGVLITCIRKGQALKDVKEHARHSRTATTEHYLGDTVSQENVTKGIFG